MDELLLGIDVGTTGTKAALFTVDGRLQAVGQAEYDVRHERPGWAEQDPADWWEAVGVATRQALSAVPEGAQRVAGVAVSSQAPAMLALDDAGHPVRPALIWMDRRADAEAVQLREEFGARTIEETTGNRADPFYVASKIRWFRTHEPELFAKTDLFTQVSGYISYKLAGQHALDNVHAALLQLRDWEADDWSPELCDACGVTPAQFPPVRAGHEPLGEVTPEAAQATGLLAGTPVMVGTVDGAAAAVEAGAIEPGLAAEMTGTSTVLLMPNRDGIVEPAFIAMPHAIPGIDLLLGAMVASGASLRWYRDEFGVMEMDAGSKLGVDVYDLLTMQAAEVSPGSEGVIFLPYMMGERSPVWHTNARGVFFGLSLATPRAALIRAILEGIAFALRHNMEVGQAAGVEFTEIRSVGGGSRSQLWNQIKADVLGLPILLPETSVGAAFGAAVLVGMGLGFYDNVEHALHEMVHIHTRYEPDWENHRLYEELYSVYRSIYESLRADFDEAAAIELPN